MKKVVWFLGVALGAILYNSGLNIVWAVLIALAAVGLLTPLAMSIPSILKGMEFIHNEEMKFSKGNKLTKAAADGDIERVKKILEEGKFSDSISSALSRAAASGRTEMVQFLIKNGADVNFNTVAGYTPLALASKADIASILLENGADVNKINQLSNGGDVTALIEAAERNYDIVKLLLENGADVNYVCKDNMTALFNAVRNDRTDIACLLLDSGANPNCEYKSFSPLMFVIEQERRARSKLVQALLDAGADVNYTFSKDIKPSEFSGRTILMIASLMEKTESVKILLAMGANVNHIDDKGVTALMLAAGNGYAEIVQILLENGADANIVVKLKSDEVWNSTAMTFAKNSNHYNCVKILSQYAEK